METGARDSVYYLTYLASALQVCDRFDRRFAATHNGARAKSQSPIHQAVNYLATLLSRGRITDGTNDDDRVVAVAAPLFDDVGYNVWVVSSPATSPVSSPDAALSPGNGTPDLSSLYTITEPELPQPTSTSTATDVVPGQNSPDVSGSVFRETFSSTDPSALLDTLALGREALDALSFTEYCIKSMKVLQGTAAKTMQNPHTVIASRANRDAEVFFATACRNKIKTRLEMIERTFGPFEELVLWSPADWDRLSETTIKIHDPTMKAILGRFSIRVAADDSVAVNKSSVGTLFQLIIQCLTIMRDTLASGRMVVFVAFSHGLNSLIRDLPTAVWRMVSLDDHLNLQRIKFAGQSPRSGHLAEEEEDTIANGRPLPIGVPLHCVMFDRMIKAACAWTAGVRHLLRTPIAKSLVIANARANVTILDLPQHPINRCAVGDLMKRWATKASWSEALRTAIEMEIGAVVDRHQICKGVVHCEAGLVASLLLCAKTGAESDLHDVEPKFLADAFDPLRTNLLSDQDTIAVGMAQKCCPVCRMLIENLQATLAPTKLRLEFTGSHSRVLPWVPPHWLPASVLESLENVLLREISKMVEDRSFLTNTNQALSPTSDSPRSDPVVVDFVESCLLLTE
ncbi:hypothetical protein C8R47DRAFT_1128925 [Mycena vitilis]|nr:hypothetical protein C8R47DRAFT_1128925 [Mycena vitilis]